MAGFGAAAVSAPHTSARALELITARARIIIDNDLTGDPDGLFQTAHHLLSPSADVRLIVGSHLPAGDHFQPPPHAEHSAAIASELMALMGLGSRCPVVAGQETGLTSLGRPPLTSAARAIIAEAMRSDARPLYYCAGGGLTDLAVAWLNEPRIADRMTLVWIGGAEYPELARPPPRASSPEYNVSIDPVAAQVIFSQCPMRMWQVPRNAYRQMLVSYAELVDRVRPTGRLGDYLVSQIEDMMHALSGQPGGGLGETYVLGDSALVTLTALQSSFEPDPASSEYVVRPSPGIGDDGAYRGQKGGRAIRVYTRLDARLTFEDLVAKLHQRRDISQPSA